MQTPTSRPKTPKTLRTRYLGLLLALMVGLAACAGTENITGTTPAPEVSVTGSFERSEDGTFVGTVSDDRVTISGEQSGVLRLRFKLNETEWVDTELTNSELYRVDLETGAATSLGNVMDADYRGLAAVLGSD